MANAFSGKITAGDISFGSSHISTNSNWITDKGSVTKGNQIVMGADSKCHLHVSFDNEKVNYIKLQLKLTSDDTSLSTDNFHAVSGLCDIITQDNDNRVYTKHSAFYPKYIFEDSYTDDFTIIQLNTNARLKTVNITLINKEDVTVKFLIAGLYLNKVVDEETFDEFSSSELEKAAYMDKLVDSLTSNEDFNDYLDGKLVIPLVDELPDIDDVPDGYICRLSTMR